MRIFVTIAASSMMNKGGIRTLKIYELIEQFEREEAAAGRPCMVCKVEDFLEADWLDGEERDLLAGELMGKDYHSASDALQTASEEDLAAFAVLYDWPECFLLSDSYDRRIVELYEELKRG